MGELEVFEVLEVEHDPPSVPVQAVAEAVRGYLLLTHLLSGEG